MPMWIKKSFSWLLEKQKLLLSYLKNTKITLFPDGCLVNFKINWAILNLCKCSFSNRKKEIILLM